MGNKLLNYKLDIGRVFKRNGAIKFSLSLITFNIVIFTTFFQNFLANSIIFMKNKKININYILFKQGVFQFI
mgnify:FL=1